MYLRGDILRVDLTTERVTREHISDEMSEKYIGGEGIGARLMWEHFLRVSPKSDPLSEKNVLIWGLGPLGGTSFGGGSKSRWTFKGPAYNMFADSTHGGGFGPQMRWAGFDHLVVTGKAKRPVYISVVNDDVQIRDASKLWGKMVNETDDDIKNELGDVDVETVCIGPGGENLVTYASITASRYRSSGRTGAGAVFGSKNLKAVAARGTKGISIFDLRAWFKAINGELAAIYAKSDFREAWRKYGTSSLYNRFNPLGWNAYRNGQWGMSPDVDKISDKWYWENMRDRRLSCSPGCGSACQAWHHITGAESPLAKRYIGEHSNRPEYAHVVPFGSSCDVPDFPSIAHMSDMCNQYSLDIFEAGMTISFLMELWQRGILTREDMVKWTGEPITLEWGNYEAVEKLIDAVGQQSNEMGRIMRGGMYKAAEKIEELKGVPALKYAGYGKGGSPHIETMRSRPMFALAGAVAVIGTHHTKGAGSDEASCARFLGKAEGGYTWSWPYKGWGQFLAEKFSSMYNSLGVCKFGGGSLRSFADFPPELFTPGLYGLMGMKITPEELLDCGERIYNVEKALNSRIGLRRKDDKLSDRWLNEPMSDGTGKGMRVSDFFERALDEYYEVHGWDKATSLQKRETLERFGLKDIADVLKKEGALA